MLRGRLTATPGSLAVGGGAGREERELKEPAAAALQPSSKVLEAALPSSPPTSWKSSTALEHQQRRSDRPNGPQQQQHHHRRARTSREQQLQQHRVDMDGAKAEESVPFMGASSSLAAAETIVRSEGDTRSSARTSRRSFWLGAVLGLALAVLIMTEFVDIRFNFHIVHGPSDWNSELHSNKDTVGSSSIVRGSGNDNGAAAVGVGVGVAATSERDENAAERDRAIQEGVTSGEADGVLSDGGASVSKQEEQKNKQQDIHSSHRKRQAAEGEGEVEAAEEGATKQNDRDDATDATGRESLSHVDVSADSPAAQHQRSRGEKYAVATQFYTEDYLNGTLVLGASLDRHGIVGDRLILYIAGQVKESSLCTLRQAGWITRAVERIAPPADGLLYDTFKDQFTKLTLWNLTEYSRILYLDSDTIVLQDISYLFSHPGGFVVSGDVFAHPYGVEMVDGFNAGVMLLRPSKAVFRDMMQQMYNVQDYYLGFAEQGFLNYYYKHRYYKLPIFYNANVAIFDGDRALWHRLRPDMKIIHYTTIKPMKWPVSKFVDPPLEEPTKAYVLEYLDLVTKRPGIFKAICAS